MTSHAALVGRTPVVGEMKGRRNFRLLKNLNGSYGKTAVFLYIAIFSRVYSVYYVLYYFIIASPPHTHNHAIGLSTGLDLVAVRTQDGVAHVIDAHCPHLGAHLGVMGRMVGNCIECPFHGWRFNVDDGVCTHVPYASKGSCQTYIFRNVRGVLRVRTTGAGDGSVERSRSHKTIDVRILFKTLQFAISSGGRHRTLRSMTGNSGKSRILRDEIVVGFFFPHSFKFYNGNYRSCYSNRFNTSLCSPQHS